MIKAIDTYYNGNYFRSRLEARWAVFFDEAGIKFQYEPEGFAPPEKYLLPYLPDFYLPEMDVYAEVKPIELLRHQGEGVCLDQLFQMEDFTSKWSWFSKYKPLIILCGKPSRFSFPIFLTDWEERFMDWNVFHWDLKDWDKGPYWRLYTDCYIDTEAYELRTPEIRANKKRFEHQQ